MNRQQHIQRLRAMADGWRGVRGRVSVSRADAALINELLGQPGEPNADVALIPAEEFVAAVDRFPAGDGEVPARPKKSARTKKKDGETDDAGNDESPEEPPAGEEETPESGDDEPEEPTSKKKSTRKR